MKNSFDLEKILDNKHQNVLNYDKMQIDNPDKQNFIGLRYMDRINKIISLVKKYFPIENKSKVGDFACAQGNVSLLLAEQGYRVFAFDIDSSFIEYSKMKYEKGDIQWINGNIDDMDFAEYDLDIAIAGELIEHCAYPEEILAKILKFVRPGGLLIITTPNGSRLKTNLPTFQKYFQKESRKMFEERQFGPEGKDHLFLFAIEELDLIVPENAKIIEKGYLGGSIIMNKYNQFFWKLFPVAILEKMMSNIANISVLNKLTSDNIYAVIKKQ